MGDGRGWPAGAPAYESFKIAPRRVAADDCPTVVGMVVEGAEVISGGETHYLHRGESVWLLPLGTVRAQLAAMSIARIGLDLGASETDDERKLALLGRMSEQLEALASALAEKIVAWDWTDIGGQPLPQPYRNPAVLLALESSEMNWLRELAATGESAGERKNGSAPSPTGSTAGARSRKRST